MNVRNKTKPTWTGHSNTFNPVGIGEFIVTFDDGFATSELIEDYNVQLSNGEWKDFAQACRDGNIINDGLFFAENLKQP